MLFKNCSRAEAIDRRDARRTIGGFVALLSLILLASGLGCSASKEKAGSAAAAAPNVPFAASYFDALSTGCRDARKDLSTVIRSAEEAANRVKAGGDLFIASVRPDFRSEERRVGKECRSRWSPYH